MCRVKQMAGWLGALGIFLMASLATAADFETELKTLSKGSYSKKAIAVQALSEIDDARVLPTLQVMLDGRLYVVKNGGAIVAEEGESFRNILDDEIVAYTSRQVKKIRINNKLRRALRTALASIEIKSKIADVRKSSVQNLIKAPNKDLRPLIFEAYKQEKIPAIKELMGVALATIDISSDDQETRLKAVDILSLTVEPAAVSLLQQLMAKEEGQYVEQDAEVVAAAESALKKVNGKIRVYSFIETVFFGLSLGSVLLLAAIGLAITFGVMGVINMAHGEMIMLGAYTTFAIQQVFPQWIEASILIAIPAAFLVSGAVGVIIERTIIRHLYGRPLETLLATFGVSLFLQQLVRTFRSNNVAVVTPDWMSGMLEINGALGFTYNRLFIIIFSLLVLGLLVLLLKKTLLGLQMRAVTQNRAMANSMGIRSSWVDALTFGLGSGIAGIAGVALSQITNVGPNMGQQYIIDSFMVVVFGGVGNLLGTFFAAMSLGVVNKFLEPAMGAVVAKIMMLIFIILFIQWRPRGLFALKGRFVED
ncbi:urea ABC transporter permease subunit UrtB [Marinagarivorans cellulosilyticus]|nr:urea ABC transporter permease subunit UrtB [Marinagarivorans cellulosilyticus]